MGELVPGLTTHQANGGESDRVGLCLTPASRRFFSLAWTRMGTSTGSCTSHARAHDTRLSWCCSPTAVPRRPVLLQSALRRAQRPDSCNCHGCDVSAALGAALLAHAGVHRRKLRRARRHLRRCRQSTCHADSPASDFESANDRRNRGRGFAVDLPVFDQITVMTWTFQRFSAPIEEGRHRG
jgi:hypothetical protein